MGRRVYFQSKVFFLGRVNFSHQCPKKNCHQHLWEESFRECFLVARICLLIKFYFTWSSRQFPEMLQHPKLLASHPSKVMDTWVLPNSFLYNSRKSFQHTGTYPKPFTNAFARNSFSLQILDATHTHDLKVLCWRFPQNSRGFFGVNHDYLYLENQLKSWVSWFLFILYTLQQTG